MSKKHFELITAMSRTELAEKVNERLALGWQLQGDAQVASEPGVPWYLMQAMTGDQPVTDEPQIAVDDEGNTINEPEYYFVIALAGQSNGMAYGEGLPLPETYDRPDQRIKQLARRSTVTPGGASCNYNDIIPADHCLHDVQDLSKFSHPKASAAQYGCVGQGLHIAKKLLPFIPANAGILLVPCCRGGSAFTTGGDGAFSETTGATEASSRWGVDKPLYKDLLTRTKAALKTNPKNILLAVVWMQGEFDLKQTTAYSNQPAAFDAMVAKYRSDLAGVSGQCVGGSSSSVPWICGDTTYYWKETYPTEYGVVYGAYKNKQAKNIFFVPFMTDENGQNVGTNEPDEDPDITEIDYYGSGWRKDKTTWTTADRKTHFGSWARRGIISDRLATAIIEHAGKTEALVYGRVTLSKEEERPEEEDEPIVKPTAEQSVILYDAKNASDTNLQALNWELKDVTPSLIQEGSNKALRLEKSNSAKPWSLLHSIAAKKSGQLLEKDGEISVRFKIPENTSLDTGKNKYVLGLYWKIAGWPGDGGEGYLSSFLVQTDKANLDVVYHYNSNQLKDIGTFDAFDHDWHTLAFRFEGGNSLSVTPVLDGKDGQAFDLVKWTNSANEANKFILTDITGTAETYPVLIETIEVKANQAAAK